MIARPARHLNQNTAAGRDRTNKITCRNQILLAAVTILWEGIMRLSNINQVRLIKFSRDFRAIETGVYRGIVKSLQRYRYAVERERAAQPHRPNLTLVRLDRD